MESHLKILSVLYLIAGALYLVGALVLGTLMAGAGAISGDLGIFALLAGFGTFFAILLAVLGAPNLVLAYGLFKHRSWARIVGLILGALNLLNFPIGTLLGGYTIWVLMQPEAVRLLEGRRVAV